MKTFENSSVEVESGIRPQEFFDGITALAEFQVSLEDKLSLEERKSGRILVKGERAYIKEGSLGDDEYKTLLATLKHHIDTKLEGIPEKFVELATSHIELLEFSMRARHRMIREAEKNIQENSTEHEATTSFNEKVAKHLLSTAAELPINMEGSVKFSETVHGISFFFDNIEDLRKLYAQMNNTKTTNKSTVYAFASYVNLRHNGKEVPVGMAFFEKLSEDGDYVTLDDMLRRHEIQHLQDLTVLKHVDGERFGNLFQTSRREVELMWVNQHLLKTELLALFENNTPIPWAKETLLKKNGSYNYEGILDEEIEEIKEQKLLERIRQKILREAPPETTLTKTQKSKYEHLVNTALNNMHMLYAQFYTKYNDAERAKRTAIALLGQFPVQDWKTITKMNQRYRK